MPGFLHVIPAISMRRCVGSEQACGEQDVSVGYTLHRPLDANTRRAGL